MHRTLIVILVFALLVAIFALQNSAGVIISLWFWSIETSLALVVILTFAAGALMGILFSLLGRKPRKQSTAPAPQSDEIPLEINVAEDEGQKDGDPEFEDIR
jgi:hypothetical protein